MRDAEPLIFISYRREDSGGIVGHVYDRLAGHYGKSHVFRDIDDIPYAKDFRTVIGQALAGCDVVLVAIGPAWAKSNNRARILESDDAVRMEVEQALASGAAVLPVLMEGAAIPSPAELPDSLASITRLNAATLQSGKDFEFQVADLIRSIDQILDERGKFVVRFPRWAGAAMTCLLIFAAAILAFLVGSSPLRVSVPSMVTAFGVMAISIALALVLGLAGGGLAARRKAPFRLGSERPVLAAAMVALVALPLLYLPIQGAAARLPIRDVVHLASRLHGDYLADIAKVEAGGPADFSREKAIVAELVSIDPSNGYAQYYSGEIKRASNAAIFTAKGCPKGVRSDPGAMDAYQEDFFHYLDAVQTVPAEVAGSDPRASACYSTERGFCEQRTAWINHLLANDFYLEAMAMPASARADMLGRAKDYVAEALKYTSSTGRGFLQCTSSVALQAQIDQALKAAG